MTKARKTPSKKGKVIYILYLPISQLSESVQSANPSKSLFKLIM